MKLRQGLAQHNQLTAFDVDLLGLNGALKTLQEAPQKDEPAIKAKGEEIKKVQTARNKAEGSVRGAMVASRGRGASGRGS